jgi:rRNA maturation RNase YbeY
MSSENLSEIYFYNQSADFSLENETAMRDFLTEILKNHYSKDSFLINFIFLSVPDIEEMNKKYLGHEYPTDVITFDFSDDFGVFGGDIFVCPDVIMENTIHYQSEPALELIRVFCHGILHLLGFDDLTEERQIEMRGQEEQCLERYEKFEKL